MRHLSRDRSSGSKSSTAVLGARPVRDFPTPHSDSMGGDGDAVAAHIRKEGRGQTTTRGFEYIQDAARGPSSSPSGVNTAMIQKQWPWNRVGWKMRSLCVCILVLTMMGGRLGSSEGACGQTLFCETGR